ncbi:MAG TPA: hypothetical protein VFY18_15420 [Candidatus Limnocylindrales bacterium]|nr:hypothetical protein [Candidatus Limnocylindrales bacterium]
MNGPDVTEITTSPARRACLVEGCTCKDARILSSRRASYFASVAKARGETADRVVEADPSWAIPAMSDLDVAVDLDAAA